MKGSRGRSTRRGSRTLCALSALGALGCQPQLEVVLVRAPGFVGNFEFVKFQVKERGAEAAQEFGPFDFNAIPDEQFAPVVPNTEFYIDVIGCQESAPEDCADPLTFNARGCTQTFITLGKDETKTVEIVMDNAVNGDVLCPPEE